jgi:hypothetical protein
MVEYAVEADVVYLAGSPKEREFPIAQIRLIMAAQDEVIDDFLPKEYVPDEEGRATIVNYANHLAAIEVRKQWWDKGRKIPDLLKEAERLKGVIREGFPTDEDDGANFIYSDLPEIDYIYMSPYFYGGSKY